MTLDDKVTIPQSFYGESAAVIGKRGSGKSHGARVLIEEAPRDLNIIVIDPQDAYLNLESLGFDYVHLKQIKDAEKFGLLLASTGGRVVIRTKGMSIEAEQIGVAKFLRGYKKHLKKGIQYLIVDEAHKYAPEHESPPSKSELRGLFQENRSDGLGACAVSQRPARLDKTILSQADNLFLFKVTSRADCDAVRGYLNTKEDIETAKKLKRGECFIVGLDEEVQTLQIRHSTTKHSGNSPEFLRINHPEIYLANKRKLVRGAKTPMSDNVSTESGALNKVLPSMEGFGDLAAIGMKMSVGMTLVGISSNIVGGLFRSPLPVISSRTLVGAGSTVLLYAGYRFTPEGVLGGFPKDVLKFAAAGGAAFTVGSAFWDVVTALNVTPPNIVGAAVQIGTGASPMSVEGNSNVDLDTFAA